MIDAMKSLLEYARQYTKLGWVVIPAPLGQKFPSLQWKKYQEERPSDALIEAWFSGGECNICLITGALSGVMVVDLDSYKKEYASVDIDSPVKSITGRGGTHLYFNYNPLFGRNKAGLLSGVDIRGEGGLVVLPPSVFEGKPYEWVDESVDFAHLPEFSSRELENKVNMQGNASFLIEDYLEVEHGTRNDSLFKVACHLIRKFDKDYKTAFYFTRLAGMDYRPQLILSEIKTIFKSAVNAVKNDIPVDYTIGAVRGEPEKKVITSSEALKLANTLQSQIDKIPPIGIPELDSLVSFIPGEICLISAETHVGKTLLALQLASAMAKNNGKRVLYISLESGYLILHTVRANIGELPETMYWYFPTRLITYKEIEEAVCETEFDAIFIDHLHFTVSKDNRTMGETINDMILQIQMLARVRNVPIIALCHLRKSQTSKDGSVPTLSDLKDTSSLAQVPSVVILIHREKNQGDKGQYLSNVGRLIVAKNRFGDTGYIPFIIKDKKFVFGKGDGTTIGMVLDKVIGEPEEPEVEDLPF